MTNENNYPINEPIFPHWGNLGSEKESEMAEWQLEHPTYGDWREKEAKGDIINKEYAKWRFMEIRVATDTDAQSRICQECKVPVEGAREFEGQPTEWTHAPRGHFVKGQIVVREQVSVQDFNTLHLECAHQKLSKIEDSVTRGLKNLEHMINTCVNMNIETRGRLQ